MELITPSGITAFVPPGITAIFTTAPDGTLSVEVDPESFGAPVLLTAGGQTVVGAASEKVFVSGFE